ncbi:MAG: hypothetical protein JXA89_07560 [Anaerolineae bacterium]|nr:hypothetical protein [Anaerolineae bacterium]
MIACTIWSNYTHIQRKGQDTNKRPGSWSTRPKTTARLAANEATQALLKAENGVLPDEIRGDHLKIDMHLTDLQAAKAKAWALSEALNKETARLRSVWEAAKDDLEQAEGE